MKIVKTKQMYILLIIACMLVVTACGKQAETSTSPKPTNEASPATPAVSEEAIDPLGKYDPPIEITAVKHLNETAKFFPGESIDNNVWSKAYEDMLGVKVKYNWVVTGSIDQYNQKLNVSMTSNELPDIMSVNVTQLGQLNAGDQLADLTEIFDKYASPLTKEVMAGDGGVAIKSGTFDGKLKALPFMGGDVDAVPLLWVRTDWLQNLNLSEPKSMDDVLKIAEAFTKQDPDGNGKNDTFGLATTKDIWGGWAGLEGFFNSYHAYPGIWVKDASGNLVYGDIQPEMKTALAKLQELYKAGILDKEFGVKDGTKVAESLTSGKVGIQYGQMWNSLFPLQDGKNKDPKMEWKSFSIPSIDEKPAMGAVGFPISQYFVITKNAKHPEAIVKLLNLWLEVHYGNELDMDRTKFTGKDGVETNNFVLVLSSKARENLEAYYHVKDAFASNDTSKLSYAEVDYHKYISQYRSGDNKQWGYERVFGTPSSWEVIDKMLQNKQILKNAYIGAPTPGMLERKSTLDKLELETFTKIIYGNADPDEFDKFVTDWKKLGGDQITKEVNDWNSAQK
ncbi:MAG TPA: extracellular solute-binding protein [Bacilli bacterium]